jgi:hypothetical protein
LKHIVRSSLNYRNVLYRRIRLKKSGSIDIQTVNNGGALDFSQDGNLQDALKRRPSLSLSIPMNSSRTTSSTNPTNNNSNPVTPTDLLLHNPWAAQCQKSQMNKLKSHSVPQSKFYVHVH